MTRNTRDQRTNRLLARGLSAFILFSSAAVAAKKPMTAADLVKVDAVRDPRISPDGKWVVYSVSSQDAKTNKSRTKLFVVPLLGGKARQLTRGPGSDFSPRWSPDGKKLAFVSTRGGKGTQLWMLPFKKGGEAHPVTQVATGVSSPIWRPDGKRLAFVSKVFPQCRTQACNEKELKKRKASGIKAEIFDSLLYRHWNHWRHGRVKHILDVSACGGKSRDLTPGKADAPPVALGSSHDFHYSPDGKQLAFTKNTDTFIATSTNNDVFVMGAEGGKPKRITKSRANDNSPHYSPDGRYLAFRAMKRPRFEADRYRLVLLDRKTGRRRVLTENFDRPVGEMAWSPDSKTLYFTAPDRGYYPIFSVGVAGGKVKTVVKKAMVRYLRVNDDGGSLVYVDQANDSPPEVYRYDLTAGRRSRLTEHNTWLSKTREMGRLESFWFKGAAGERVHAFLLWPPPSTMKPGKKVPVINLIHGGPQGMFGDSFHPRWNVQMFAAPGYAVLMINFHGSVGYGQAFTDSITGDWGGKPYKDVMMGLKAALKKHPRLDRGRVGAAGASYGGYMVNWIGGHNNRYKCLVSHAGVFDLTSKYGATEELWFPEWELKGPPWGKSRESQYRKFSPSTYVKNWKTPTLVIHGQHDYRVPVTQGMQLFTALQRLGVPSRFLYYPDEDHFVQKPKNRLLWWKTVYNWFARYLKP